MVAGYSEHRRPCLCVVTGGNGHEPVSLKALPLRACAHGPVLPALEELLLLSPKSYPGRAKGLLHADR
jgi:hypothetical protein